MYTHIDKSIKILETDNLHITSNYSGTTYISKKNN